MKQKNATPDHNPIDTHFFNILGPAYIMSFVLHKYRIALDAKWSKPDNKLCKLNNRCLTLVTYFSTVRRCAFQLCCLSHSTIGFVIYFKDFGIQLAPNLRYFSGQLPPCYMCKHFSFVLLRKGEDALFGYAICLIFLDICKQGAKPS